ncbi:hypothetical protein JSQ81_01830 [Sporosarcina sp. Marseille-Q4063]|uniref:hypothetical protein n=1 Tax=Sporosarcina sp. Marseille-Q4063 TaxID=2810514 RepID=UPI001BAF7414|nr:hypothetical protein [Sporosarcina sp. Marseille-Q4063]QUW22356.1 hypothetical protein JSQ81_01830 [Sporosarcina sp. Marseille-Q4063]
MHSKLFLAFGSLIGAFILVYGTAVMNRMVVGDYYMNEGLVDVNYAYLSLLCAVPFVLGCLVKLNITPKNRFTFIIVAGLLFAVLFTTVHWAFVYYGVEMAAGVLFRTLLVLPISALLVVFAVFVGFNMEGDFGKESEVI